MSNRRSMPEAKTIPLEAESTRDSGPGMVFEAHEDVEDAKLQTGMPARNLRTLAVGVMAVGLLVFVLWPTSGDKGKQAVPEPQPTDLVSDLVDNLQRPPTPFAVPEYPEAPPERPVQQAPSEEVDERIQLALLSPMAASDVELRNSARRTQQPQRNDPRAEIERLIEDQQRTRAAALEQQSRLIEDLSSGALGPGSAGPAGMMVRAASSGDGRSSHTRFLADHAGDGSIGSPTQLQAARMPATLYEGTIVRTVLTRALNSELPGMITARVTADLYDSVSQKVLLVPRGSEVTCRYDSNLHQGQKVILAACTRLRLPNGKSFALSGAPAGDEAGATGMPAKINNHFWEMFGTALVVGASSYLLPRDDRNITVVTGADGGRQTAGNIMGSALSQVIDATIAKNVRIPPTGTVEIGTPFTLTLTRDVEMEPYMARQRGSYP